MTRTIEKTVFAFDELSDRAKESAREWYREGNLDYEWWDCVYEDAAQCGTALRRWESLCATYFMKPNQLG